MILSLILYGSRARGDHRHNSDVDLLGIVEDGVIRRGNSARDTNIHLMSLNTMRNKSRCGDLFILHILREGRILVDPSELFDLVKDEFVFKNGYGAERGDATAIALFLISNAQSLSRPEVRKRLVWSWRTMIIADSAEKRTPVFGARDLEKYSDILGLKSAIDKKIPSIAVN